MRDHVGHASSRLIRRQRKRELGIEERRLRAEQVRIRTALQPQFIVGNNTRARPFGTRRRNSKHAGDRQTFRNRRLLAEEVPHIAFVRHAKRNRFGAVNRAAAANGENNVDVFFTRKLNALAHQSHFRIRTHARELNSLDARRRERLLHAVERSRAHHGTLAVYEQRTFIAALGNMLTYLVGNAFSENEFRRRIEHEIVH